MVLSLVKPCGPCWEIYKALMIKITYTPHISTMPTLGVHKNMISIHPKLFYSYIGDRHKNMFVRINAPSFCCYLSWKFQFAEGETWAMQKLFIKKEKRRKSIEKIDKCPRYLKQWVLRCPPEKKKKKEMNKIAHVFLQKFSKFQTREICFKEHSRIRIATIYMSTHMHILI